MNILVAGNGLDLQHGYKTGYVDFLTYAKDKGWNKDNDFLNYFISEIEDDKISLDEYQKMEYAEKKIHHKWIDCEYEIKEAIDAMRILMERTTRSGQGEPVYREKRITSCFKKTIGDNPIKFLGALKYKNNIYNKERFIKSLKDDLQDCISRLREYLLQETEEEKGDKIVFKSTKKFDIIICFNYTNVVERYISMINSRSKRKTKCYWVHGSLSRNNMVLGTENEDKESLDFVYFKKYFQRIQKETDHFYRGSLDGQGRIDVHFYGCSFGKSDKDLMRELLWADEKYKESDQPQKISHIYCYGQRDYESKVINLIEILGRDDFERWYYDKKIQFCNVKNGNRDFGHLGDVE
ncbi:MAG: hypothetical protein IJP92_05195 [Lachnospiraceae bacterium]|nr:hypothetical protein [Lachnospiraceae bacterium]